MADNEDQSAKPTKTQQPSQLYQVIKDRAALVNLLGFSTFLAIIVATISVTAIVLTFRLLPSVSIETSDKGTLIVRSFNEPPRAVLLLPASVLWVNTGITLTEEADVDITASGSINLAVHRLVQAAQTYQRPRVGWVGPDGQTGYLTEYDEYRRPLLVEKAAPYGCVLAVFSEEELGPTHPRPSGNIKVIGHQGRIRGKGTLWLTVNEVVVEGDKESELRYISTAEMLKAKWRPGERRETVNDKRKEFTYIKTNNYSDVFFKDNIGDFLITIEIPKNAKFNKKS